MTVTSRKSPVCTLRFGRADTQLPAPVIQETAYNGESLAGPEVGSSPGTGWLQGCRLPPHVSDLLVGCQHMLCSP